MPSYPLIDSHAHLTHTSTLDHVEEILQRAEQHNICAIVNICTDTPSLKAGLLLAERHRRVFNTAAVTPHDVEEIGDLFFPEVVSAARDRKVVAVGETGLDYHYSHSPKELQQKFLQKHLELAEENGLPVVFHCREAFEDLFAIAKNTIPALLHCFTGNLQEAKGCLEKGWMISLSGIVTFKNADSLREIAAFVPLDSLLIETDAPYLAPLSKRGKVNEPSYIVETAQALANIKGIGLDAVANATSQNAARFFCLPKHIVGV